MSVKNSARLENIYGRKSIGTEIIHLRSRKKEWKQKKKEKEKDIYYI